jgi:hypothetical protein
MDEQPTPSEPGPADVSDYEHVVNGPLISTIEGWRGPALPLSLTEVDLDLLDLVLCVYPELRVVTFLGQQARARGLNYPVENVQQLIQLIGEDRFELGEHRVDATEIGKAMPEEWFPLSHEGDLLTATHRALLRCSTEAAADRAANLGGIPPISGERRS